MAIAVVLVGVALAPAAARADFQSNSTLPVGETAGLMGGAAAAWVSDGSAAWYNPAGLGVTEARTISANFSAYGFQQVKVPGFVDLGNGSKGSLRSTALALFPSYISYHQSFSKGAGFRHGLGFAVVVPDFERIDGLIDIPPAASLVEAPTSRLIEFRARYKSLSQTVWTMPAWGGCWSTGRFCVGAGLALGFRTDVKSSINDVRVLTQGGTVGDLASDQQDIWLGLLGGSLGMQVQLGPMLRFGANVRAPVRSLVSGGSILRTGANAAGTQGLLRRVEEQDPDLDYRLPVEARAGVAFNRGRLRLALDVIMSPAQGRFPFIRGRNGERELQPTYFGVPIGDPIPIGEDLERSTIVDGALGVGFRFGQAWELVGGAFTNTTGATDGSEANLYGDRVGATLGITRSSGRSTTRLGVTGIAGWGRVAGVNATGMMPGFGVDTSSLAVYVNFGGTAEL